MKVHNTHFLLFTTVCYLLLSEGIGFIIRSISIWVKPKPIDMLRINLSQAEIERLSYERYYYPCPIVQKRIQAVYIKATTEFSDTKSGQISGLYRHSVNHLVHAYQAGGFESLCQYNYGINKSELENHSGGILKSFTERPMTGISRSPSPIRTFMKHNGLRYIKTGKS